MRNQQEPTFNLKVVEPPDFNLLVCSIESYENLPDDIEAITEQLYLKVIERSLRQAMNNVIRRAKYVDELDRVRRLGQSATSYPDRDAGVDFEALGD
jgi:hypothetical protein